MPTCKTQQSHDSQKKSKSHRLRAAILAIGTEVSDGQIVDRNSAWISSQLVDMGFNVTEHRVVPDERELMAIAMRELMARVDLLFLTGGLGPTSDDFTREVLCEVIGEELEFDELAWSRVQQKLQSRGVQLTNDHRRQCDFPCSAEILLNSVGTADGFFVNKNNVQVYVLPGPPAEISAIWQDGIVERLRQQVSAHDRESLLLWRTMGKGESEIAALIEPVVEKINSLVSASKLSTSSEESSASVASAMEPRWRVGYRAHAPYVEVKIWTKNLELDRPYFLEIENALAPYLVNRNGEDLAYDVLEFSRADRYDQHLQANQYRLRIVDHATQGLMAERFVVMMRDRAASHSLGSSKSTGVVGVETKVPSSGGNVFQLEIVSDFAVGKSTADVHDREVKDKSSTIVLHLGVAADAAKWQIRIGVVDESKVGAAESEFKSQSHSQSESRALSGFRELYSCEVSPIHRASVQSERGRKYICERTLQIFLQVLRKSIN